ncbi:MAG TPA: efflux transporter outer membrane subunit [Syntrophales bacterium]|nr:efflux transporter outer membrane subunit [Syntrophales bacterium]
MVLKLKSGKKKMKCTYAFLFAFSVILAGCMIGPDYQRPPVDKPDTFRYAAAEARDTSDQSWWKQFHDPVLEALIDEALAHNKNLKIAAANIEQAAGVLTQVRAPLFPQLSYGGSGARERGSEMTASPIPPTIANPQSAYQVSAAATWEIDLWGRIRRLSESAQANLLATEAARRGVILSLVASVANTYIQLRGLDAQLLIAKNDMASYGEAVKLFELQFKYGQVSRMTVEQARTRYETAAATVPQIESQVVQTENALSILLGRNPGPITRGKQLRELAMPSVPSGLPSQLLERRPDIVQAEQNLIAANAQIGAAKALYFPSISLTGSYGQASDDLSNLFKGPARQWSYSGSVTGPIFTAGAISGQVQQAEAARKAALLAYEASIQSAFADVENALISRMKTDEQVKAQGRLVDAAREYTRLAQLKYKGGYVPYSTVLQAQEQLFPAELNYAQYSAALYASLINIYKAMGGGWVAEAEKLSVREEEQGKRKSGR